MTELTPTLACKAGLRHIKVRLEFKVEDLWIGAFWRRDDVGLDIWVCLLPCLPLHIWTWKEDP